MSSFQWDKFTLTWRANFSEFSGMENDVDEMTKSYRIFSQFFTHELAHCVPIETFWPLSDHLSSYLGRTTAFFHINNALTPDSWLRLVLVILEGVLLFIKEYITLSAGFWNLYKTWCRLPRRLGFTSCSMNEANAGSSASTGKKYQAFIPKLLISRWNIKKIVV